MGGMPPLGYDVKNRKLVVNDAEARIVVDIYRRYLVLRSVHALRDELGDAGIKSKCSMRPDGGRIWGPEALFNPSKPSLPRRDTHKGRGQGFAKKRSTRRPNSRLHGRCTI
jgi:hypothetical protein